MCGILCLMELLGTNARPEASFRAALDALAHRGPDGQGVKRIDPSGTSRYRLWLGHRRLSIFDRSDAGAQPMSDRSGRWIIYNGEVFNWPELREELERYGHHFTTRTDTEVILAAYAQWGVDCVNRFNGFWAFVIYDPLQGPGGKLFVSRDRFGIKPLYVLRRDDVLVLASEIGPALAVLEERPRIDSSQLARYAAYDLIHDGQNTIYEGVQEHEPGCNATVDLANGERSVGRYWEIPSVTADGFYTMERALDRFSELVEDAVRLRLRADREVALTLSGGIDSSVLAVAAARVAGTGIRAFTSHFPGHQELDETHYAALVARKCRMDHVLVHPTFDHLREDVASLSRHQELPYTSLSMLVNWCVMREISRHGVAICLNGQGGDELFLGYERYYTARLLACGVLRGIGEALGAMRRSRLSPFELLGFVPYFASGSIRKARYDLIANACFDRRLLARVQDRPRAIPIHINRLQADQLCGEQMRRLLRYDDRSASAFGIESRPAFLDHRIVEFAVSLGWKHKIVGGWTKTLLRKYLHRAGLPTIAWRTHKLGYPAPTLEWTDRLLSQERQDEVRERLKGIMHPELDIAKASVHGRFKLYNLFSLSREMDWSPL